MLLVALLAAATAWSVASLQWQVDSVNGDGWQATGIDLRLLSQDGRPALDGRIGALRVDFLGTQLTELEFSCLDLRLGTHSASCLRLDMAQPLEKTGKQRITGTVSYDWHSGRLDFRLENLGLAGGLLALDGQFRNGAWVIRVQASDVQLPAAMEVVQATLGLQLPLQGTGDTRFEVSLSGRSADITHVTFQGSFRQLNLANEAGTLATDGLGLSLQADATPGPSGWSAMIHLAQVTGQFYAEPVFLDLQQAGLETDFRADWNSQGQTLELHDLRFEHRNVLKLSGSLEIGVEPEFEIHSAQLAFDARGAAYAAYLRPFFFGTPAETLSLDGRINGELDINQSQWQSLWMQLQGVSVADSRARIAVEGLDGKLDWREGAQTPGASSLAWRSAELYRLPLGPALLAFQLSGADLMLTAPAEIPVLGGALDIDVLSVSGYDTESEAAEFAARLRPIDLSQLTLVLGWPSFSGSLSGTLPRLSYQGGEVVIGGKLQAQAFGGQFAIDNFRISRPFSDLPQCYADLTMTGLDLEQLTRTFAFGRITGHVDGTIKGLHLFRWSPVAFQASLQSTGKDSGKRRISQRAIDNISRVSGGPGALLSTGLMSVFEDFGYEKLGLSCTLSRGVCWMSGVEPVKGGPGYYIVKGRGLPRIDVVGHREKVDWPRLVEQLKSISRTGGPVVK